jgi:hypothetical protein
MNKSPSGKPGAVQRAQLSQNSKMMATVQNSVKDLTRDLPKEAQGRADLKAQIAELTTLLRSPI